MILQMKTGEANLTIDDGCQILLDGEGRITGYYEEALRIRRAYDDRWLRLPRPERGGRSGNQPEVVRELPEGEITGVLARIRGRLEAALAPGSALEIAASSLPNSSRSDDVPRDEQEEGIRLLRQSLSTTREAYRTDGQRFRSLVGRIPVLPPDRYRSLYLVVAPGCRYNRCLFCELYRDRPFATFPPLEVQRRARELVSFFGRALPTRTSVFLGDASGLAVPQEDLESILRSLHEVLPPRVLRDGIHTFVDVFVTRSRHERELRRLSELGLRRLYIGLESASPEVLSFYRKPHSLEILAAEVRKARAAGIATALMILAGGAPREMQESHLEETLRFLRSLDLEAEDRIFLSPLVIPEATGFREEVERRGLSLLDAEEIVDEVDRLTAGLAGITAKVSRYQLKGFLYR